jgi:signal transduction histidine kinase
MSSKTPSTWNGGSELGRAWRRIGFRVLALQIAALLLAFGVAGALASVSIRQISERAYQADVLGETASLNDEWRHKGVGHLPYTITKRSRLWHGFEYGLAGTGGVYLAGDDALAKLTQFGWSRPTAAGRRLLAYTEPLPGGGRLTVGRDLTTEQAQMRELTALLTLCGAAGVFICLGTAYLTTRWTWRRLDRLSATAALVAAGRLDVRAPVHKAASPDEIDELSLAFNAMLERISRLVDQLRRVTTDVAHDMRRPFTRLRQKLDRLRRQAQPFPELSHQLEGLDAEFVEILRTFDALLQLAEIEGSARPDDLVDLREVTERVTEALRPDIEDGGRSLVAVVEPGTVRGDSDLLAQILVNLVENAARHTPMGTRIVVRVEANMDRPRLRVSDNGPGIPEELRALALAPWGRLEASRNAPGSGLGLAIVASIAARHGAQFELRDGRPGLDAWLSFQGADAS